MEKMKTAAYKKVLARIKEILVEKPDIHAVTLSFQLHNEGLIKSIFTLTPEETQNLTRRLVARWRKLYEDEKIRVEQELPTMLVWFSLREGDHFDTLGYMT